MDGKMEELVIYAVPKWTARRQKVGIPKPEPEEVLVKVIAAGLNPKDWKYAEECTESNGLNAGDDVAGVIEAVGSAVSAHAPGDRVAGLHRLGEPAGAYAQYALVPASTTFKLPASLSFEAGATLPLACMTAAIALYQALGLPLPPGAPGARTEAAAPSPKDTPVLIYGGSSAVGAFALQLARLSGLNPIVTVAGAGVDFVRSLGAATHVVDYRAGDAAYVKAEIARALDGKPLHHAFDCVGVKGSWDVAAAALAAAGHGYLDMTDWGNVLDLDPVTEKPGPNAWTPPKGVKLTFTLVSSAYGDEHDWISAERAKADAVFAEGFYPYMSRLLEEGKLRPHPHQVLDGGLDGVLQGVLDLLEGKVSARKLVARIADTPGL